MGKLRQVTERLRIGSRRKTLPIINTHKDTALKTAGIYLAIYFFIEM